MLNTGFQHIILCDIFLIAELKKLYLQILEQFFNAHNVSNCSNLVCVVGEVKNEPWVY